MGQAGAALRLRRPAGTGHSQQHRKQAVSSDGSHPPLGWSGAPAATTLQEPRDWRTKNGQAQGVGTSPPLSISVLFFPSFSLNKRERERHRGTERQTDKACARECETERD